jgi:orotidine-5'-phosphate decarboxylase
MIEYKLTDTEQISRRRTCLAVDVPNVADAVALARQLSDLVGMFKVGKEIHTAAGTEGIDIIYSMSESGASVFLDLKFHDTPATVYGAARAAAVNGVYMFNLHVSGNELMCRKALEGAMKGADERGIQRPKVIGVTELTSLNQKDLDEQFGTDASGKSLVIYEDLVMRRTELARKWGLDGVVCPANQAGALEQRFGQWLYVTPGIKFRGVANIGQQQLDTPDGAVQACKSSILVLGSAITHAGNVYDPIDKKKILHAGTVDDRRKAAYGILQAMAHYV